ncbi:MAG: YraN family protein [Candidatus Ryanbacteria bacterium]|nr:YraN family protein [Candidatus Ryanbacteria bacterium]
MSFMEKYSEKRRLGNLGEDVACLFLVKQEYRILDRNYLRKWGELDVVAKLSDTIHFIEVKTVVSHETSQESVSRDVSRESFTAKDLKIEVSRETDQSRYDQYRPEENVHYWKQKRIMRAIQTYILEKKFSDDQEWQIDIITVRLDFHVKTATINHIENVVFDV